MVDLSQYIWIVWLIFVLIFVIIELLSLEFTFLMLAFGSIAGLGANLLGWPWWLQILIAAVVSVLLIVLIRPLMLKYLKRGADPTPSNIAALMGMRATVVSPIGSSTGSSSGLAKLANGETWTARLADTAPQGLLETGTAVTVTAIEGSTAVITPLTATIDPSPEQRTT